MNICEKLKSSYNDGMTLEQLIDAFENSFMNADSEEYPELMFLFDLISPGKRCFILL